MAAGTFRSTYYGVGDAKKDFDLHLVRVVPPSNNYKPSRPSNVMPSEAKLQRGRRTFAMSGASPPPPAPSSPASEGEGEGKSKSSWKKAVRGLFKSSASGKRKGGDPQSAGSSPAHPGPQQRSRSSTWSYDTGRNVASRPATSVEEGDRGKSPFKALGGSEDGGAADPLVASLLIRLTLLPRKSTHETDVRQVTLKRKPNGFGVHLSGGFPPIRVTYVEPGGEAELAGVEVGDEVLEVNGQDCSKGIEVTKLMELKMLIQQVAVGKASSTEKESSGLEEEKAAGISIDDAAWERIKSRQLQDDDLNSEASSSMEITRIDEVSDSGSVDEQSHELRAAAVPSPLTKEVHISEKDWSRVRTQRGLLFEQNSPSAVIQEKGKEMSSEGLQTATAHSTTTPGPAPPQQKTREHKAKRKKKKSPSSEDLDTMASSGGELVSPVPSQDGQSGKTVQGSKAKKRKKTASAGSVEEGPQRKSPSSRGMSSDGSLSPTGKAEVRAKKKRKRSRSEETDGAGRGTIEQAAASLKAEIDPSLKVKKSGVVIGPSSSRGNSRRPSLSLFDQSPKSEEEGKKEGEQSPEHALNTADVDLSAVPHTAPTLGLKVGHAKRDVSLKRKRHRASTKDPLHLGEGVQPDKAPQRRSTMPSKLTHGTKHSHATGKAAKKTTAKKEEVPSKTEKEKEEKEEEEEEEGEKLQNLILHTHRNSMERQESNGFPALSADRVARATSLKRQESAESANLEKAEDPVSTDETKENRKKDDCSPLTKLRRYPPTEGLNILAEVAGGGGERAGVSRRLFPESTEQSGTGSGKETSTGGSEAPMPPSPVAKASPTTAAKPRRMKSVEMPVKTLVMASEGKEGASSAPGREATGEPADAVGQRTQSWVQLRKVGHGAKTVEGDSSVAGNQPAWVAIAQNKHKRTSVLYGNQEGSAESAPAAVAAEDEKEAVSQEETGDDHTPSLTSGPSTKGVEVKADDPSTEAGPTPSATPTSKHMEVKEGVPSPRTTEARHTPSATPTSKHVEVKAGVPSPHTTEASHTSSAPPTSKHVEAKASPHMTEANHTPSAPPTSKASGKDHAPLAPRANHRSTPTWMQESRRTAGAGHTPHHTLPTPPFASYFNQDKKAERAAEGTTPPLGSGMDASSHHAPSATPPSHQPLPKKTDSSLPRAGHVRDRLAMFQYGK